MSSAGEGSVLLAKSNERALYQSTIAVVAAANYGLAGTKFLQEVRFRL